MGMTISCDGCGRQLSKAQGDEWWWAGDEQETVRCSICDPEGVAFNKQRVETSRVQRREIVHKAKLWDDFSGAGKEASD